MLNKDGKRIALTLSCALYSDGVPLKKSKADVFAANLGTAYLTSSGSVPATTEVLRKQFCDQKLHETICICLIVSLPFRKNTVDLKIKKVDAKGKALKEFSDNVYVHLDWKNIHQLLGEEGKEGTPAGLYDLLAYATKTKISDWKTKA